jgi:hypothetical protein
MYSKQPVKQPWVVSKVAGEPCSDDPLQAISPEHPPEAVVAAQVAALRECDFDVAYALTSPVGRAVAGTRDRFRAALQVGLRVRACAGQGPRLGCGRKRVRHVRVCAAAGVGCGHAGCDTHTHTTHIGMHPNPPHCACCH